MTSQANSQPLSADQVAKENGNRAQALIAGLEMDRAEWLSQSIGYPGRKQNLRRIAKALRELRAIAERSAQ